jgi:polyferredoxin
MAPIDVVTLVLGVVTLLVPLAILLSALFLVLRLAAAGDLRKGYCTLYSCPTGRRSWSAGS